MSDEIFNLTPLSRRKVTVRIRDTRPARFVYVSEEDDVNNSPPGMNEKPAGQYQESQRELYAEDVRPQEHKENTEQVIPLVNDSI